VVQGGRRRRGDELIIFVDPPVDLAQLEFTWAHQRNAQTSEQTFYIAEMARTFSCSLI